MAKLGQKLELGQKYLDGINNHLYNIDGVFLPLSTNPKYIQITAEILDEALEENMPYVPATFKRTKPRYSITELASLKIDDLAKDTGFRARAANSPLFHHLGEERSQILPYYQNGSYEYWKPTAQMIPGHNQACERLVGDLKRSKDIDTSVTISEKRSKRPRSGHKHIIKGNSLEG